MRALAPIVFVVLVPLPIGCSLQRSAEQTSQQLFDQFTKKLDELAAAIDATPTPKVAEEDDLVVDLRHRVGALEEILGDLFYQCRNDADAQATLNDISRTLADARKATQEGGKIAELHGILTSLKGQVAELRPKLK